MEEESWRKNVGGILSHLDTQETPRGSQEASWRRNHRGGIMEEESLRRNHGGGVMEEESRRRHPGGIIEEESWRRNH